MEASIIEERKDPELCKMKGFKEEPKSKKKGNQQSKKVKEIATFTVPFSIEQINENLTETTNKSKNISKERIINQAFKFHSDGKISEAANYYKDFIYNGFEDHRVFSNYGIILKDLGQLKEAELSTRKAINLKPDFAEAYSNLAIILKGLGK